jgi:hypothetical protein
MPQFSDDLFLGSSQTFMGTGLRNYNVTATGGTGSVSSSTLTITALNNGAPIALGMFVDGTSVTDGTYITAFGTGVGGTGTYTLNQAINIANTTALTLHSNTPYDNPSPMDLGVGPLGRVYIWDTVPQAAVTNNLAVAASPTTTYTLAAGTSVKAVTLLDGSTGYQLDVPRAVAVTIGTGTIANRNVTINGYDYYGQAMSEVIATGTTQSTTVNGKKAFYIVTSATVSGAVGGTTALGTTDILGIPVRVFDAGYIVNAKYNNTLAANAGNFVAAVTATATTTTGDVRGTFAPSGACDGIKRLVVCVALPGIAVGPNSTRVGALGVTQA